MNIELARFNMIEQQIRPWEVLDQAVLSLLATVRREDFVPPAMRALAFVDTQVPLIPGEPGGPCMLEPKVEARLLQELQVAAPREGAGDRHRLGLHGRAAGAPRTAGLHARVPAGLGAHGARQACTATASLNARVVDVSAAEGAHGLPAEAPFDVILLSGSVAEVPRALLEQLKIGGRLAAVVGDEPVMRARLFTRAGEAAWSATDLFDTVAPRLEGFAEPSRFHF